jgi:hypothetical protein
LTFEGKKFYNFGRTIEEGEFRDGTLNGKGHKERLFVIYYLDASFLFLNNIIE